MYGAPNGSKILLREFGILLWSLIYLFGVWDTLAESEILSINFVILFWDRVTHDRSSRYLFWRKRYMFGVGRTRDTFLMSWDRSMIFVCCKVRVVCREIHFVFCRMLFLCRGKLVVCRGILLKWFKLPHEEWKRKIPSSQIFEKVSRTSSKYLYLHRSVLVSKEVS